MRKQKKIEKKILDNVKKIKDYIVKNEFYIGGRYADIVNEVEFYGNDQKDYFSLIIHKEDSNYEFTFVGKSKVKLEFDLTVPLETVFKSLSLTLNKIRRTYGKKAGEFRKEELEKLSDEKRKINKRMKELKVKK